MGYLTEVNILVTGSNGQLGTCIKDEVVNGNSKNIWHFADRSIVDITDIESIRKFVIDNNIKVIIERSFFIPLPPDEHILSQHYCKFNS